MTTQELYFKLENPDFFAEGILPAHSDHFFYEGKEDITTGENSPLKQSLNGIWKFKYSANLEERPESFFLPETDVSQYDDIIVPSNVEIQGFAKPQYVNDEYPWEGCEALKNGQVSRENLPVGSYVKKFILKDNLKNKRVFISLQGVQSAFRLFLNGKYICYSEDSFTPAEAELTDYLAEGENYLAIEVYKYSSGAWLEDQDMWRLFGIFREVYLYAIPNAHLWDMKIVADYDYKENKGLLSADYTFEGKVSDILTEISDACGNIVFSKRVNAGDAGKTDISGMIENVLPWSGEEPNLYILTVTLFDESGSACEYSSSRIGFRHFAIEEGIMKLNGKRIVFRGVNRHEFSADKGRALGKEEMIKDIISFKKNNINAVRTSHYPNQSMWYRLCDEYGIYMIGETNLETHGTWTYDGRGEFHQPIPESKKEWLAPVIFRADNMLKRDRNHPAVLIWSLGNESYGGSNFVAMHDYLRKEDPTRPVHYEGVVHNPEFAAATDIESRMYEKPANIEKYITSNPSKPFICCEYMHAMGNSVGGMKLYTDLEDVSDSYQGGFIWDYVDQALYKEIDGEKYLAYGGDFGDRPHDGAFSGDGIVFADRTESPKLCEVKQLYAPVRITVETDKLLVENRNSFTDLSDYSIVYTVTVNGKEIQRTVIDRIECQPLTKTLIDISPNFALEETKDYVIKASLILKADKPWVNAGHEICFGEKVILAETNPVLVKREALEPFKHIVHGKKTSGVSTQSLRMLFNIFAPGPVSLNVGGKEYFEAPPIPIFTRAFTDNDRGCGFNKRAAIWTSASYAFDSSLVSFEEKENFVEAIYDYKGVVNPEIMSRVTYRVFSDDTVKVIFKYFGNDKLSEMPLAGWEVKLPVELENVRFFGKGPDENYIDRNNGYSTGVYETSVSDNLTHYLRVQECGNRTDVRWIELTDETGKGLCFACENGTFETCFLHYSTAELGNANHIYELPGENFTWLRITAVNTGVGGDDSWGAPVHPEFKADPAKDHEVVFVIKKVE